jgi:hypothetical protein
MRFFFRRHETAAHPAVRTTLSAPTGWIAFLHLVVITTFAVTQPVYDRLSERPAFLSDSGLKLPALLLLVVLFSVLVPGVIAGLVTLAGRLIPRLRDPLYAVVMFGLLVVIALPIVKRLSFLSGWEVILLALALAAAATWTYFGFRRCRSLVTAAAPAIAIFPAIFLLFSPVRQVYTEPIAVSVKSGRQVPVVVVVFDEFRGATLENEQREIDAERFPHFAELARGSTWFRNATTVSPDTWLAVPALLTSKYPAQQTAPMPGDLPQNLFSVLDATAGYESAVFEPVSRLSRPRFEASHPDTDNSAVGRAAAILPALERVFLFHLAPNDLHEYLPEIPRLWFGLHDSFTVDRELRRGVFRYNWGQDRRSQFDHFLNCLDDSAQPALFFQHILLPHVPWCYLPSGRNYLVESRQFELLNFDTHNNIADFWGTDDYFVIRSQQRHLLQLQYVDRLVGRLLDRLRETGLYDKCLLVVTADHGICFRTGESRRTANPSNLADVLSIPLFVKLPGQRSGDISDKNVENIDVLPTIADFLGIRMTLPIDGRSMLDTTAPDRTEKKYYASSNLNAVPVPTLIASRQHGEIRSRFGPASDPEALYRIGPYPELVGKTLEELPVGSHQPVEIELTRGGTFYSPDPQDLVPCYLEGRVLSAAGFEQPITIAVAVNGRIRAVTRTYLLDGIRDRWSVIVPEAAYHEGENDVQYFAIDGAPPDLRLTPCVAKTRS